MVRKNWHFDVSGEWTTHSNISKHRNKAHRQIQTHTATGSLNFPTCWIWYIRSPPLTNSMTKYSRSCNSRKRDSNFHEALYLKALGMCFVRRYCSPSMINLSGLRQLCNHNKKKNVRQLPWISVGSSVLFLISEIFAVEMLKWEQTASQFCRNIRTSGRRNRSKTGTIVWKHEWRATRNGDLFGSASTRFSVMIHSTSSSCTITSFFKILTANNSFVSLCCPSNTCSSSIKLGINTTRET